MKFLCLFFLLFPLLSFAQTVDSTEYVEPPEELEVIQQEKSQEEPVYDMFVIDQPPLFNGQDMRVALAEYLSKNVNYPDTAKKSEVEGKVIVSFTINKDSTISDIKVVSSPIGYGLEEEAVRVIESTQGMWTAAEQGGYLVASRFMIPINFQLF